MSNIVKGSMVTLTKEGFRKMHGCIDPSDCPLIVIEVAGTVATCIRSSRRGTPWTVQVGLLSVVPS